MGIHFSFYTIDCIKAGYLRKNKGVWYLTDEGEKANLLGPIKLLDSATQVYKLWAAENKQNKANGIKELTPPAI